jgi:integrase
MLQILVKQRNKMVTDYLENVKVMSKSTALQYEKRLKSLTYFSDQKYRQGIDFTINKIKRNELDVYEVLAAYAKYLLDTGRISSLTLKQWVVTAKNLLEFYDVDISPKKFKLKVRLPRAIRRNKEALTKEFLIEIFNSTPDLRLKTYLLLLSATGMRASEALSVRVGDLALDSNPPKVYVRGEYTKTKTDRYVLITRELKAQLMTFIEYKYRTRRVSYYNKTTNKIVSTYITPNKNRHDLLFSAHKSPTLKSLYAVMRQAFAQTLDRMGKGEREESAGVKHRRITLHSCRRLVKSTLSDLGLSDFGEWMIGHQGSTYYRTSDKERAEIFRKIEPYLTYTDITSLDRRYGDTQSRIEELEEINQSLRQRDKMKDDAIGQLSDQLMALTVRLQEVEKKQREY